MHGVIQVVPGHQRISDSSCVDTRLSNLKGSRTERLQQLIHTPGNDMDVETEFVQLYQGTVGKPGPSLDILCNGHMCNNDCI